MPIYLATLRDDGEKINVWEETNLSTYRVPFVTRRRDCVGRYWLVGLRECSHAAARFGASHMISKEKESRENETR